LANHQVLQNYYAQLYGLTSPATPPFHQYVGYMPSPAPRTAAVFPPAPAPQVAAQAFVHHPAPLQIQGPFLPVPSFPQEFRLLLPSHVVSVLPPSTTGTNVAPRCIRFFLGEQDIVCSCYSWFRKFSKITYVFVASEIWQICSHLIDHRQAITAARATSASSGPGA
jgi:hypothetical protein